MLRINHFPIGPGRLIGDYDQYVQYRVFHCEDLLLARPSLKPTGKLGSPFSIAKRGHFRVSLTENKIVQTWGLTDILIHPADICRTRNYVMGLLHGPGGLSARPDLAVPMALHEESRKYSGMFDHFFVYRIGAGYVIFQVPAVNEVVQVTATLDETSMAAVCLDLSGNRVTVLIDLPDLFS